MSTNSMYVLDRYIYVHLHTTVDWEMLLVRRQGCHLRLRGINMKKHL